MCPSCCSNNFNYNPEGIVSWTDMTGDYSGTWSNFMICPQGTWVTSIQMGRSCIDNGIINWKVHFTLFVHLFYYFTQKSHSHSLYKFIK